MRLAAVLLVVAASCAAFAAADPVPTGPDKEGWVSLMNIAQWKKVEPGWIFATEVGLDPKKNTLLKAEAVKDGTVWVNGEKGRLPDLYTKSAYGDCEVHVEFLIAKNSNAGIKFHGVYEIQILDSYGTKKKLTGDSMGGIYPRADASMGYKHIDEGIAPKVNAAKAPGEWQVLDVVWQSPRFDEKKEKTANAMVVKAVLNGQLIHENQELKTPTGANWTKPETPTGSFMLQADHGPVAFRNVRIKPTKP